MTDQVEHWQKFAALLLWKTSGTDTVTVTAADIEAMMQKFPVTGPVIYTSGKGDTISFRLVSQSDAAGIAEQEKRRRT